MALPVETEISVPTSTASPSKASSDNEQGKCPSLLTVRLLVDIPIVKAIIEKSESTWRTVKEGNVVAKWTLNAVEVAAGSAAKCCRIFWLFEAPIGIADRAVSRRIIEAERKWPILKESPNKVIGVTLATARSGLGCLYTASAAVAADGKRAVTAMADFTRIMANTAQTFLANFQDLVDEIAAKAPDELRVVEGQPRGSSEASTQPAGRARHGVLMGAARSGIYLYAGAVVWAMSNVPVLRRFAKTLTEHQAEGSQNTSSASPTDLQPKQDEAATSTA